MTAVPTMRRALIILLALILAGCASHQYGGYYDRSDDRGDYYYGAGPIIGYSGPGWYSPYDSLFWNLRYSYWDPFWYPNFHYGVTFFPRYYYGWPYWNAGSYWGWRGYHPYSPHYGSWWDHYYHWQRPTGPRRQLGLGVRGAGGSGPERYGSARNAAERLAQGRGQDLYRRGTLERGDPAVGASLRQRAMPFAPGHLPSSRYAPRGSLQRSDSFQRGRAGDGFGTGLEGRQRGPALDARSRPSDPSHRMRLRSDGPARGAPPVPTSGTDAGPAPAFRAPVARSVAPVREAPPSRGSFDRPSPPADRGSSRPDRSFSPRGGIDRPPSTRGGGGRDRSER